MKRILLIVVTMASCLPATISGPVLSGDYQSHRIKLSSFAQPNHGTIGLLVKARVDDGPQLRLLLDSGAEHLVLDNRAAKRSGYSEGARLELVGAGTRAKSVRLATARRIEIGTVAFQDFSFVIAEGEVLDGVDGVIPLSMFAGFLVKLDVPGRTLELEPYPSDVGPGFVPVRTAHRLLFVDTTLDGQHQGSLLLDTGSYYNVISNSAAKVLRRSRAMGENLAIVAGAGKTAGRMLANRVSYEFGDRKLILEPVVAVDLEEVSRRNQFDVSGVIGFPALANSVVTVSYRDAMVRITGK